MSKKPSPKKRPEGQSALFGLGLDNDDGHKRITKGDKFAIYGGKAETHEKMTETLVKTFEELKHRGKSLEQADHRELAEIIHKSTPR